MAQVADLLAEREPTVRLGHRRLGLLALRDLTQDGDVAIQNARVWVDDGGSRAFDPCLTPFGPDNAKCDRAVLNHAAEQLPLEVMGSRAVIPVDEVCDADPSQRLRRHAEDAGRRGRDGKPLAVRPDTRNHVAVMLGQHPEAGLALAQPPFELQAPAQLTPGCEKQHS